MPSGGVEQPLNLIEHSPLSNIRHTAFLAKDTILSVEVNRRLEKLVEAGLLDILPSRMLTGARGTGTTRS